MVAPSKTLNATAVHAWQTVATGNVIVGSAIDVSTKWAKAFYIQLARVTGTAFTAPWPRVRIEAAGKASSNDKWIPLYEYSMAVGASIASTSLNGAVSGGATTCVVTAATNIVAGDLLFLGHTTTAANYEIIRVKGVSGTTVTFEEACTNAHDTGAVVTDQAEVVFPAFNMETCTRCRVVIDNAGGGQSVYVEVHELTYDSFA